MENILISIIFMVIGLLGVLAGYKTFKIFLAVSAFIFGFNLGFQFFPQLAYLLRIVLAFLTGAILGLLSYFIYKIGIFLMLTALGMELARLGITALGINPGLITDLSVLIIGIVIGVVALIFKIEKFAIIIATTIGGAAYFIIGLMPFVHKDFVLSNFYSLFNNLSLILEKDIVLTIVFIVLVVIGLVVQFKTNFEKNDENYD